MSIYIYIYVYISCRLEVIHIHKKSLDLQYCLFCLIVALPSETPSAGQSAFLIHNASTGQLHSNPEFTIGCNYPLEKSLSRLKIYPLQRSMDFINNQPSGLQDFLWRPYPMSKLFTPGKGRGQYIPCRFIDLLFNSKNWNSPHLRHKISVETY